MDSGMGRSWCVLIVAVVAAAVLHCAAAQTAHVVGDSMGWTIPQGGASYTTWASSKKFVVGDILLFNFATNGHDVVEVSKASYDTCSSTNPIGTLITTGPANITLASSGNHYYICTFSQHCQLGQKLAVTVSASSGATPPESTPSHSPAPTTNTPPATPSPTSGTPDDCAPTPSPTTMTGGPTAPMPPAAEPTTPNSSSSLVLASFFLSFLSIVMGFFL